MNTYLMYGKYSQDSLKEINSKRTNDAQDVIKKHGGVLKTGYAMLGDTDLLLIVELPDTERAMQTSAALSKLLGISFSTTPAISIEDFDRIMG